VKFLNQVQIAMKVDLSTKEAAPRVTFLGSIEIFFNTINHGLIAITTFYLTWYCIKTGFAAMLTSHALISTIGYQVLMAEGIMVMYKQNSYTFRFDKAKRTTIHWILLYLGTVLAIAGLAIEYIYKNQQQREHFVSNHALWGISDRKNSFLIRNDSFKTFYRLGVDDIFASNSHFRNDVTVLQ